MEIERPYKLFERPRPKGDVYAAGQDEVLARWNLGGNGDPAFVSNRPHFHPGARVIVRVEIPSGKLPRHAAFDRRTGRYRRELSETAVLAQARRKGYWPFRMCFEDGLRRDQHVHGKVSFVARLTRSGHAGRVRVVKERLPDDAVRACLADRVRALEFTPGPVRALDIGLSVELWPGDAPVPLTGPPDNKPVENPGELDADAVERAAASAREPITACYEAGLSHDAALWGRVQLQIDLDDKGHTERVRETESRFTDREVSACIVKAMKQVRFPAPAGGAVSFVMGVRLGELAPLPSATTGNQDGS